MGDRANVYVHEGDTPGVYLYTHYDGSELPLTVRTALARRERWDDMPYLTRIIFCAMVGHQVEGSTGYGIDSQVGDGADRIVDIDVSTETVTVKGWRGHPENPVRFHEFVSS